MCNKMIACMHLCMRRYWRLAVLIACALLSALAATPSHPPILVVTVDGALQALSRSTGENLWSTPLSNPTLPPAPLVSVSGSSSLIPSVGGKVHLPRKRSATPTANVRPQESFEVYDTMSVSELVSRAPFVDDSGRVFAGSKRGMAIGVDWRDGSVRRLVDAEGVFDVHHDDGTRGGEGDDIDPDADSYVVWVGRTDYDVTVYDIESGKIDVLFSTSEVQSSAEMLQRAGDEVEEEGAVTDPNLRLFATAQGALAMVGGGQNPNDADTVSWVAPTSLSSPIVTAIDPSTNRRIPVTTVEDDDDGGAEGIGGADRDQIVVKMLPEGEGVYGLPITGSKGSNPRRDGKKNLVPKALLELNKKKIGKPIESKLNPPGVGGSKSPLVGVCNIKSQNYPECLAGHSIFVEDKKGLMEPPITPGPDGKAIDSFKQLQQAHLLYQSLQKDQRRGGYEKSSYRTFLNVLVSWVPPAVALVFVLSFEMGRRKRLRDSKLPPSAEKARRHSNKAPKLPLSDKDGEGNKRIGSITISSTILGYGCHGTVVFLGSLHNRKVAVKRMLSAYDSSAANEIDLLCRTDDHANLIRYFMRETDGEFVYLALELCDRSMCDAVEGGVRGGEVGALEEVMRGVEHLHKMRIVHRDIKPQNILMRKKGVGDSQSFSDYVVKISDMGLGRVVIAGQSGSSFGGVSGTGATSTGGGGGAAGSVGWQAQEVIRKRLTKSSSGDLSNSPLAISSRSSKFASDIFSLGCLFQFVLVPGSHPFGAFYERENNILMGKPTELRKLMAVDPLAYDLVSCMVEKDSEKRPKAKEVLKHPMFWDDVKRLGFLCDLSDQLEVEGAVSALALKLEGFAASVFGSDWSANINRGLLVDAAKYRSYDPASVVDLLRFTRNKRNHADSLPVEVRNEIGPLSKYFQLLFPRLLGMCWRILNEWEHGNGEGGASGGESMLESGVVVWCGSDAAFEVGGGEPGYGWWRSSDEFQSITEIGLAKGGGAAAEQDAHLNNPDPKFRTRICTNWLASKGTKCAMKDRGKCIFAHSPCELRVKEGKRMRWGKLVNKESGLSNNPRASGGEDTYGAAMGVETMREQEGKWGGRGGGRGRGRGGGRGGGRGRGRGRGI